MNCGGMFIAADFLYWRVQNPGFSYSYEFETTVPANQNIGKIKRVDPSWKPAFRVGAGWNTPYDFWDVFLNYTWVLNTSSTTKEGLPGFLPLWPVSSSATGQFAAVHARAYFMMNMGDLEIGRLLYLTQSIAIRPHLGLRGGTLHQKFKANFSNFISGSTAQQTFNGHNNYWGIGPRTGFSGEMHLNHGFSLLGKAAGALLYGKMDVNATNKTRAIGVNVLSIERSYKDDDYELSPTMQLLFGFQWQTCFWCEKMFFRMSASWEANYWWNQFNLPTALSSVSAPMPTVGNQPVSMQGLTVNFEWDF